MYALLSHASRTGQGGVLHTHRTSRRLAALALVVLLATGTGSAWAGPRTERVNYTTGVVALLCQQFAEPFAEPGGIGEACFGSYGATSIKVTIKDVTGLPVEAAVMFYGPSAAGRPNLQPPLGFAVICSSATLAIPKDTRKVHILIGGERDGDVSCSPGLGTKGTITAEFR